MNNRVVLVISILSLISFKVSSSDRLNYLFNDLAKNPSYAVDTTTSSIKSNFILGDYYGKRILFSGQIYSQKLNAGVGAIIDFNSSVLFSAGMIYSKEKRFENCKIRMGLLVGFSRYKFFSGSVFEKENEIRKRLRLSIGSSIEVSNFDFGLSYHSEFFSPYKPNYDGSLNVYLEKDYSYNNPSILIANYRSIHKISSKLKIQPGLMNLYDFNTEKNRLDLILSLKLIEKLEFGIATEINWNSTYFGKYDFYLLRPITFGIFFNVEEIDVYKVGGQTGQDYLKSRHKQYGFQLNIKI